MQQRIKQPDVYKLQPAILKSLIDLGNAAAGELEHSLIHLVKLRASQINGCAFCQHMHANEARKDGEQQHRLDVLPAWREVAIFTARERAALAWTEALTQLSNHGVSDACFTEVREQFNEKEIVNLSAAIATINAWNRIAVGFNFAPNF
ncbi:carboxymuconolactone decarboxylase family protein [Cellvibrio sp. pealriver]|uniref:carboxymuconolactone decarboxylase family protein n=1 Tax=Cellvibrio sp. pealriver TaxID=1622269 RepID=UPI00066FBEB4|nr:carboxymuconolactone decarboxylase family protein [Cellvibrio sp. pealriver]